jgi:dolichol-phosphate mannosyltransferase
MDLLPEEAYYWNYARHLDIGYLDHPPMVAWLNFISESVLGKSEFAVRLPAFLEWFLLAYFMYRLTLDLFDKAAARLVIPLLAILPIYMSVGFLMTPDAPFYVTWAGCLFFLERALLASKSRAWWGVGVCLGLGLLSKYTMGLLIPATALFMIFDKDSRRWLVRPQPYVALLVGLLLFLPVIYWNYTHDWISFTFQGSRRWSGQIDFQLHILIGSALILLSPLGAFEAGRSLVACWRQRTAGRVQTNGVTDRTRQFMLVFTLVPLAVFIFHSLRGQPKLNWTGPVWLAILPMMASELCRLGSEVGTRWWHRLYIPAWKLTGVALLVFYWAGFGYIIAGMPGAPVTKGMPIPVAWKEFGDKIEELETALELKTQAEPVIVGLDQYWISSEATFYDPDDAGDNDTVQEVAALGLFGKNSLMWNRWALPKAFLGRVALLVSFNEQDLQSDWVTSRFSQLGDITKEAITKNGNQVGHFFWRVGYGYRP